MSDFYVYAHLRADGSPFYIGKGKGKRAYSKNRSTLWKRVVTKEFPETRFPTVAIVAKHLDETTAFEIEQFWIAALGRRDIHPYGTLVNHTDGGEGISGLIHKEETKEKIRTKATGRKHSNDSIQKMSIAASARTGEKNHFFGRTHSDESRKKISANSKQTNMTPEERLKEAIRKGAQPIWLKSPDGVVYNVVNKRSFCKEHRIHNAHLYELISGKRKTVSGWSLASNPNGVV